MCVRCYGLSVYQDEVKRRCGCEETYNTTGPRFRTRFRYVIYNVQKRFSGTNKDNRFEEKNGIFYIVPLGQFLDSFYSL